MQTKKQGSQCLTAQKGQDLVLSQPLCSHPGCHRSQPQSAVDTCIHACQHHTLASGVSQLISAYCALLAKGWQACVTGKMTLTALKKPLPDVPEDNPK